ncbi:TRM11 family SAM-dependent methyltransferase [Streptomonospora nanhaiensis]|uniref:TRM11 family SAM-dependent methyltransferase n=1 Tax=Streptomonospora nanhaiensis TaxID=1323731 RepID=UPI001C383BEB|nr:DNA methyltransferase [Streptomonospora nanhaiensis]MBV2366002.1 site-specific DNA-methyltransferase [Streptomonospora nanhaiensis]MBX9388817.1 site-specific DNA-methyltransferase [Streptomonospora nanhaiensis]
MSAQRTVASVWVTGQQQAPAQRGRRYSRLSLEHPAKMLPAIARRAISEFTRPGHLVLDPLCGIGTTLVEALHLGRDALGFELEPKWASIARLNLDLAHTQGAQGQGRVRTGEAARTAACIDPAEAGAALLVTSPPYGAMTHGRVRSRRDGAEALDKWAHRYSTTRDRAQLAHQPIADLLDSFTAILTACRPLLLPGAHVVITVRPFRTQGRLIDFPGKVMAAAQKAGLEPVGRCAALLCALRQGHVVARSSFFASLETARLRSKGIAAHIIQHEDVLILRNPTGEAP